MEKSGYEKIIARLRATLEEDAEVKPVPKEGEDVRFVSISSKAGIAAVLNALARIPGKQDGYLERLGRGEGFLRPELAIVGMPDNTTVVFDDLNCR